MRKTKKAVAAILTLLLIVSMTACAPHGKNLTMDALVNASTRDEVIELLGDSFSAAGDSDWYESVEYMGEPYSMLVSYCDNTLDNIAMHCDYEGMRGMDLVLERLNYTVTARERQLAKNALEEVACELTENMVNRRFTIHRSRQRPAAGTSVTVRLSLKITPETISSRPWEPMRS